MRTLDEPAHSTSLVKRESLVERVLEAIATSENVPTTELPPLFDVVDPDALSTIFASPSGGPDRSQGTVTFPYTGYQVTLDADGSIDIEPVG